MQTAAQSILDLPGVKKLRSGKVREVFDLGDTLLFVATDRISAFDVILPDPIPKKGAVLNQLSAFWFNRFGKIDNHFVNADFDSFPKQLRPFREQLAGRSMIVRKTKPLAVECVVRGYLAGHGENIDMKKCAQILGQETAERVKDLSLQIYSAGRDHAGKRGIIVADTKFEFGTVGDKLLLIDEVLTPDSSRFWPADHYIVGQSPPSFDKQFVRDYLETLDWNKTPPGPKLPGDVVARTAAKYVEAFEKLTGEKLR